MAEFRYPDGSWPRPIKEMAASIRCIDGTTSANQAEHLYHASGHYYRGLHENVEHLLRCHWVPYSWLASTEEMANHICRREKFNLVNCDKSIDGLYAFLRAAQSPPRPPPGFKLGEQLSTGRRPSPRPQPPSSALPPPLPLPRVDPLGLGLQLSPRVSVRLCPRLGPRLGPRTSSPVGLRHGLPATSSRGQRVSRKRTTRSNPVEVLVQRTPAAFSVSPPPLLSPPPDSCAKKMVSYRVLLHYSRRHYRHHTGNPARRRVNHLRRCRNHQAHHR